MARSRLQHLQKEDLPPGVAIGRGTRFAYDLDATFMIVLALELSRLRMPARHAAALVKANWPTLRALVNEGLRIAETPDRDATGSPVAVIPLDGLHLLRRIEPGEVETIETIHAVPRDEVATCAAANIPRTAYGVVDVVTTVVEAEGIIARIERGDDEPAVDGDRRPARSMQPPSRRSLGAAPPRPSAAPPHRRRGARR